MTKRTYDLGSRAEAMRLTRERILDAAEELLSGQWFDEVTLADIGRAAGVSTQTVVNHFGSKVQLYLAGVAERVGPSIDAVRSKVVPGDLDSIVEVTCEDYERTGDGTVRLIATASRSTELAVVVEGGRASHRAWVEHCFGPWLEGMPPDQRTHHVLLLATVLDVSTWNTLRRIEGLSQAATARALHDLIEPLLGARD